MAYPTRARAAAEPVYAALLDDHATRAALLRELGRSDEARQADQQALAFTSNPAERALLEQRLA